MLFQGSRYVDNLGATQLLLTSWSRILPEQLTFLQLVNNFPAVYGTRKFIAAFTSDHHLSLIPSHSSTFHVPLPTSWRHILILFSHLHLDLPSDIFYRVFPPKHSMHLFCLPSVLHVPPITSSFFMITSIIYGADFRS